MLVGICVKNVSKKYSHTCIDSKVSWEKKTTKTKIRQGKNGHFCVKNCVSNHIVRC